MSIVAVAASSRNHSPQDCTGCGGVKAAPLAAVVYVGRSDTNETKLVLCEECGRDLANAVGFMCIRDGGWSKLEPRKKSPKKSPKKSTKKKT